MRKGTGKQMLAVVLCDLLPVLEPIDRPDGGCGREGIRRPTSHVFRPVGWNRFAVAPSPQATMSLSCSAGRLCPARVMLSELARRSDALVSRIRRNGSSWPRPPKRVCLRPGLQCPHLVDDFRGGARPIDQAVLFFEPRRFGGQFGILHNATALLRPAAKIPIASNTTPSRVPPAVLPDSGAVSSGPIGVRMLHQARTGIELRRHVDHGDAGLGFAVVDGPIDRRRPAIFRQQRGVQIDAAQARQRQRFPRKNLPVVAHDKQIGRLSSRARPALPAS